MGEYISSCLAFEVGDALTERVRLLVLDSLGCAILAAHLPPTERLLASLRTWEGAGTAQVWMHPDRLSVSNAALVNATAVHGFEFDDITTPLGHYGCVTVPIALALADGGTEVSGSDLVASIICGIEIGLRMNECTGAGPHLKSGFHGPSIFGTFAAAATASALLRLSADQCVDALAHAAQFTSGLMGVQHGGMGKRLLAGHAARNGIFAAQLASSGFTNTARIFDCGYGSFPSAFNGGREEYDLSLLSAGLGEVFKSEQIGFKLWACRIPIHPTIEAVRALRAQHHFDTDQIERVEVLLPIGSFQSVGHPFTGDTPASAQLNLQYCVAVMLLDGDVSREQFEAQRISDPVLLALARRVHPIHDPSLDDLPGAGIAEEADVQIELRDGTRYRERGRLRGVAGTPIAGEVIIDKFRRLCTGVGLSVERQDLLVAACGTLGADSKATTLTSLLGPQ